MDDNISRQIAQKLFGKALTYQEQQGKLTWTTSEVKQWVADFVEDLPAAQPEQHYDEWCDSCKEYDKEKHSCPRWNKVIKSTVDELKSAQPEPCEDAVSRAWLLAEYDRQHQGPPGGARKIIETAPSVMPKQRTGKWVFKNDIAVIPTGYYECSECKNGRLMYKENFCPNCGAKMEGDAE